MTVVVITDLTTDEARRRSDGEVVLSVTTTQATPEYARDFTDRLKGALTITSAMVIEAYQARMHAALRYSSWDDYCNREGLDGLLRIPRETRPQEVRSMRDAGFSIRAIASAAGVDPKTVRNDLSATASHTSTGENSPVEVPADPKTITGVNGKTYARKPPPEPAVDPPKTEPKPARKTNRKALPKQFDAAGWELRKSVERLEKLVADDRFNANKEQVASHLRGHLTNAIEVCQDLLDRLN